MIRRLVLAVFVMGIAIPPAASADGPLLGRPLLSSQVTIHRDEWGVPHIDGPTDESVVFGFGYAQAEDFLWQVEDSFVLAIGRYAELYGPSVFAMDDTTHRFEIPSGRATTSTRSNPDFNR